MKMMTSALVALFAVAAMANEPAHTATPAAPAPATTEKAAEHKDTATAEKTVAKAEKKTHKCKAGDTKCEEKAKTTETTKH